MAFAFLFVAALSAAHIDVDSWAFYLFCVTYPIGAVISFHDAKRRLKSTQYR